MIQKRTKGQKIFNVFNIFFLTLGCAIFIIPYWIVIASSFTDEITLISNGYNLFPKKFSIYAYKFLFEKDLPLVQSFINTILNFFFLNYTV